MQEREFWQLLEEVFGRSYGRALAKDQQLMRLDDMTVVEALHAGLEPRVVWNVLCDQMDIPDSKRWGRDHNAPPIRTNVRIWGIVIHSEYRVHLLQALAMTA